MALTGVPLMVGSGFEENPAEHPADLFRQLVADFVRGSEGVMRDVDLRVAPQETPDGSVRIGKGGVVVLNRALGGDREAYYDFNDQDFRIDVPGTDSQGGRSDLIVAMVKDPWAAGTQYQIPANPARGPYMVFDRIPFVAKSIFNPHQLPDVRSAVGLARIDQPARNSVITSAMIKDVRPIANGPQRYQEPDPPPDPPPPIVDENPWTESRIQQVSHTLSGTGFSTWPSAAVWSKVPIPPYANGVDILAIVKGAKQQVSDCVGEIRVGIDDFFGTPEAFDLPAISADRSNKLPIIYSTTLRWSRSSGWPGSLRTVRIQARNTSGNRGRTVADPGAVAYIQLVWKTVPIIN